MLFSILFFLLPTRKCAFKIKPINWTKSKEEKETERGRVEREKDVSENPIQLVLNSYNKQTKERVHKKNGSSEQLHILIDFSDSFWSFQAKNEYTILSKNYHFENSHVDPINKRFVANIYYVWKKKFNLISLPFSYCEFVYTCEKLILIYIMEWWKEISSIEFNL